MMRTFRHSLEYIGDGSVNHTLSYNLILWSSFIRYYSVQYPTSSNYSAIGYGQLQYMQMTGLPSVIFNTNQHQTIFSTSAGLCDVVGFTQFDLANGYLYSTINYTVFMEQSKCYFAANPLTMGFSPQIDNNIFNVGLDVRSFATALGVNNGILRLQELSVGGRVSTLLNVDNYTFLAESYYDTRYEYMNPIVCVSNITEVPIEFALIRQLCFLIMAETVMLPVFNHYGASNYEPEYCSCHSHRGKGHNCQIFNLMISLIYYPQSLKSSGSFVEIIGIQISTLLRLVSKYSSYTALNIAAYNASWSASANAYGDKSSTTLTTKWQQSAFTFCQVSKSQSCSILTFNLYAPLDQTVSQYKYQLQNGSCRNTFVIDANNW
jgi:hypothetical protein